MPNPLTYGSADFTTSGGSVDPEQLRREYLATSFPSTPVNFVRLNTRELPALAVEVWFDGVPDATDEATSDGVISAHTAAGVPRLEIIELDFAASLVIDLAAHKSFGRDFAVTELTGAIDISFSNPYFGAQGTIYVRQDAVGGRAVSFTAPGGWTILTDEDLVDLNAGQNPDQVTAYAFLFVLLDGDQFLHLSKSILT